MQFEMERAAVAEQQLTSSVVHLAFDDFFLPPVELSLSRISAESTGRLRRKGGDWRGGAIPGHGRGSAASHEPGQLIHEIHIGHEVHRRGQALCAAAAPVRSSQHKHGYSKAVSVQSTNCLKHGELSSALVQVFLCFSYASLTSDRDQERVRATLKVVWSSRFTSWAT